LNFAGCTAHPDGAWVTQQARQITWTLAERPDPIRLLIRDHDRKFTRSFDEVFQGAGIGIVRTPIRAPQANGIATIRSDYSVRVHRLVVDRQHASS
jgi:putative transposase